MVNFKTVVNNLQKHYKDAESVAIISKNGKLLYSTKNWNIKSDIRNLLSSWASGSAQSVTVNSIRYSIVQMEPERFIATNLHKKGQLIGATTPDGENYMIAHVKAKAKGWEHLAYPAVVRAAAMLKKGSKSEFVKTDIDFSKEIKTETVSETSSGQYNTYTYPSATPTIDPTLKAEVEMFLEWVKNPEGLGGYISYYLQTNDSYYLSKLAEIYQDLYRIFFP
ncbi:MAG: hypothetical protein ACXACC_05515 [Promethearchaeota archaeon]|jgi:hypothetical protein